jgi:4-hydroxy-tetrahydrodipicolinate reductase
MIKVALIGYGKMGKTIEKLIERDFQDMQIVLKINQNSQDELTIDHLKKADIAIEFTQPSTASDHVRMCFEAGIPVVCGTTGWYDQLNDVKQLCIEKKYALLYATNFSIGMNIFFEIHQRLAHLMSNKNYHAKITEIHHTAKLDIPSGTAVTLAEQLIDHHQQYNKWELNEAESADPMSLAILAIREENVPGTHLVKYENDIDVIELIHEAKSRDGFAQGAILAARWLIGKQGYFGMNDVLNTPQS